jgi:DNA-binding beta-propeller fold protein YncE
LEVLAMTGFVSKRIVHTLAVLLIGASAVPGGGVAATFRHPPQAPATSQVRSSTLYVSSYQNSTVTEYRLPGGTAIGALGTSAGIYNPGGLFFAKGQLYVPTGPYVLIFPAGSSKPSMRLQETDISGDFGGDVTVGKDGTVYDVNLVNDACGVGDFEVFLKGQTSPAYTVNMESWYSISAALDASDDLFVAYYPETKARIIEYAPGAQTGKNAPWHIKNPGGIAFDQNGDLVAVDGTKIEVFAPGSREPVRTFGALKSGQFLAFDKTETVLYVADSGANLVDAFDYASGTLIGSISSPDPTGVAVDPPAPPQ